MVSIQSIAPLSGFFYTLVLSILWSSVLIWFGFSSCAHFYTSPFRTISSHQLFFHLSLHLKMWKFFCSIKPNLDKRGVHISKKNVGASKKICMTINQYRNVRVSNKKCTCIKLKCMCINLRCTSIHYLNNVRTASDIRKMNCLTD